MIQRCYVCAKSFWPALSHCRFPVFLSEQGCTDLRFLSNGQRQAFFPSVKNGEAAVDLYFSDNQDYTRFVLAYLLAEGEGA